MKQNKNDSYYVSKILHECEIILRDIKDKCMQEFLEDDISQGNICFRLIQISENAKKLSDEYKTLHSNIRWIEIVGLRNRAVHDYGSLDMEIIYYTATEDIVQLYNDLK